MTYPSSSRTASREIGGAIFRPPPVRHAERDAIRDAWELLRFVGLAGRENELARNLPYGDQRRLELARALATRPRLLLLDEPTAGMNPSESGAMVDLIRAIRDDKGTTIILIEHQMRVVMGVCEQITVLDYGRKISEGAPAQIQSDPAVIEAYLGHPRRLRDPPWPCLRSVASRPATAASPPSKASTWRSTRPTRSSPSSARNGAGKTTTLRAISGLVRARAGTITFASQSIEKRQPHDIVRLGISHVPEGRGIFARLTVYENLQLGSYIQGPRAAAEDLPRVFDIFPRLKERASQTGGTLSGGEQQMLAIGRALMARPKLLLMDEPSMGLSPLLVETIFRTVSDIRASGTPILLVEQNAALALEIADRAYVLESGVITLQGTGRELAADDSVRRAYLGEVESPTA